MTIWAIKGLHNKAIVNLLYKGYNISIDMKPMRDGQFQHWNYTKIRVLHREVEVTQDFNLQLGFLGHNANGLASIFKQIDSLEKLDDNLGDKE